MSLSAAAGFDAAAWFAADGPLAARLPGYRPRPGQREMAAAVWDALAADGMLAVEAGTGVGKTFAYLLPVLRRGGRTLVCTGTRHLQDQLYHRDLPVALRALGEPRRVCLLKGRANYLCRYRCEGYLSEDLAGRVEDDARRAALRDWAARTERGDLAEFDCPEDDPLVPAITSTAENCLGSKCPAYEDCFVVRARARAREADLVVANHHLFAADLALREDSLGDLLPNFDTLVFDEAHRLAGVLETFLGTRWSATAARQLLRDAEGALARQPEERTPAARAALREARSRLDALAERTRAAAPDGAMQEKQPPPAGFAEWAAPLRAALGALAEALRLPDAEGPELEQLAARAERLAAELGGWPGGQPGWVEYLTLARRGFALHRVPIDISGSFAEIRGRDDRYPPRWIFASATLSAGDDFAYFRARLGLGEGLRTRTVPSPFDFRRQTRLYLPRGLPDPRGRDYTERMLKELLPLLRHLRGRTLLLFTSLRALRAARDWLDERLDCALLVQGAQPRAQLLERFAEDAGAVLLGSIGFWEGIDVPGPALSCVVLDKIPFRPHRDLLQQARSRAVEAAGGDAFADLQLPQAGLLLKQGLGRLIRRETDRGVAVIADPRLRTKGYGRQLRAGLPDMPECGRLAEALDFLDAPA